MALNPEDLDFEKNSISVTKTYYRLNGRDVISRPKTNKSRRIIYIPKSVMSDLQLYIQRKQFKEGDRVFPFSAAALNYSIKKYSKVAGVPKIRIHDLRHSHTSLLVSQGFNAAEIADRLGHEKVETTLNIYTHLYAQQREEISESLETIINSLNL